LADSSVNSTTQALYAGAAGIIAPMHKTKKVARQFVSTSRYQHGTKGFSSSTRAGGYGQHTMAEHVAHTDHNTIVERVAACF